MKPGAPAVVAILGPTATGKSALALAVAARYDGEIINCDSTAVYRGFDIGTDKIAETDRRGIRHHLIDIVDPTQDYTAAQYACDAAAIIRDVHTRGRLPILVGGTGLYFRALTRGLFPAPGATPPCAGGSSRLPNAAACRSSTGCCARSIPNPACGSSRANLKRLIRALEVFLLTGRPLTAHFADTVSPIPGVDVLAIGLRLPAAAIAERVTRRVDEQFARGLLDEIRTLLAARDSGGRAPVRRIGVPPGARAPARRARRGRDARAHRAGESSLRTAAVDLVPQRA